MVTDQYIFGNLPRRKFEKYKVYHILSANQRQLQKFNAISLIHFQGILQEIARKCLN